MPSKQKRGAVKLINEKNILKYFVNSCPFVMVLNTRAQVFILSNSCLKGNKIVNTVDRFRFGMWELFRRCRCGSYFGKAAPKQLLSNASN